MNKSFKNMLLCAFSAVMLTVCCSAASVWDGTASDYFSGSGSKDDPFVIATAQNLAYIASESSADNFSGLYFVLSDDIVLNGHSAFETQNGVISKALEGAKTWTPIGSQTLPFAGNFDGAGHSISGLYCVSQSNSGLFGCISDANISNLIIYDSLSQSQTYAGLVCGKMLGASVVDNVVVSGTVCTSGEVLGSYVGGISGTVSDNGLIQNSCSYASVVGSRSFSSYVGGIAGINYGEIFACTFAGTAHGESAYFLAAVGGIAGDSKGTIASSISDGKVSGVTSTLQTDCHAGGISGQNSGGEIFECENKSEVSVECYSSRDSVCSAGGIVGYNLDGKVYTCTNLGSIEGASSYAGGICGANFASKGESVVRDCLNTSAVTSTGGFGGGITGINASSEYDTNIASVLSCVNASAVSGGVANGIIGTTSASGTSVSKAENCYTVSDSPDSLGTSVTKEYLDSGAVIAGLDANNGWVMVSGNPIRLQYADGLALLPSFIQAKANQALAKTGNVVNPVSSGAGTASHSEAKKDIGLYSCFIFYSGDETHFSPEPAYVSYIIADDPSKAQVFNMVSSIQENSNTISGSLTVTAYCPESYESCLAVVTQSEGNLFKGVTVTPVTSAGMYKTFKVTLSSVSYTELSNALMSLFFIDSYESLTPIGDVYNVTLRRSQTGDAFINVTPLFPG